MALNHMSVRRQAARCASVSRALAPRGRGRDGAQRNAGGVPGAGAHHEDRRHAGPVADLRRLLAGPASASTRRSSARRFGELDPTDPKNAVIVDIELAPRNASGKVEYAFDFYILKPIDLTKGSAQGDVRAAQSRPQDHGRRSTAAPAATIRARSPTPTALANTFLMPRGYTMVWSGWDYAAGTEQRRLQHRRSRCRSRRTPTASSITGPAYEYIVTARTRRTR